MPKRQLPERNPEQGKIKGKLDREPTPVYDKTSKTVKAKKQKGK